MGGKRVWETSINLKSHYSRIWSIQNRDFCNSKDTVKGPRNLARDAFILVRMRHIGRTVSVFPTRGAVMFVGRSAAETYFSVDFSRIDRGASDDYHRYRFRYCSGVIPICLRNCRVKELWS